MEKNEEIKDSSAGTDNAEEKMLIAHDYDAPASTMAKVAKYELPACIALFAASMIIIAVTFFVK